MLSRIYSDTDTQKKAQEELRDLFINHSQDPERIAIVLSCLSENNEHQKSSTKKELIKVLSILAEIYESRLLEFLPKIVQLLGKRIREGDPHVNQGCADAIGSVVGICLKGQQLEDCNRHLAIILKTFFHVFSRGSKYSQIGAAMCVTKVVQTSSVECLSIVIDDVVHKLVEVMKMPSCKAHLQIMEAILSLILASEDNPDLLRQNVRVLLPVVVENMANSDWNVRKISIEVMYTISMLAPDVLQPHRKDLLTTLNHLRFDKVTIVYGSCMTSV